MRSAHLKLGTLVGVVVTAMMLVVSQTPGAQAASFVVDRTDDPDPTVETTADDCTGAANDCTLRGAILAAAASAPGTDAITLPAGTYTLTSTGVSGGDLLITSSLILTGDGADDTIVDANGGAFFDRVMTINCGCAVELSGLTLTGGRLTAPDPFGAGLLVLNSTVQMDGVQITDNIATESGAGSGARGAGIQALSSNVTLANSALTANQAVGAGFSFGGGIRLSSSALTMRNSTISGNTSGGGSGGFGGGLRMEGASTSVALTNVTITNNTATTGAGLSRSDGAGTLINTIIVANNGDECSADTALSAGNNLSDDSSCNTAFDETSDLEDQPGPHLAALADNGGTTPTHALLATSTGVDAGLEAICDTLTNAFGSPDGSDQRGVTRSLDGNADSTVVCDIGAFELEPDGDGDGVVDSADNCPDTSNPGQENTVHSGSAAGDACDDPDGDGDFDNADNCPDLANANQLNTDGASDGGDACDSDDDDDEVPDVDDNCPLSANPGQEDDDADGIGNPCDPTDDRPTCNGLPATILVHSGTITGTSGDDVLVGDAGVNIINGGGGNDTVCGRDGDDTLSGGAGTDLLRGEGGVDTVNYASAAGPATANLATGATNQGDTLNGIENVKGSPAGDTITGNAAPNKLEGFGGNDNLKGGGGADNVSGGLGDDTLNGGAGADNLNGGSGNDTVSYAGSPAVTITLGGANNAGDTVALFENVVGSSNADTITGNAGPNVISGGSGNDTINGGSGNDTLNGGGGQDTINGGGPTSLPGDECRGNSNPPGQQDVLTNCEDSIP